MTALELLFKTKENPQATDDAMLLWLYERWKSEEGQRLQHKLEKRDAERNTPRAIFSYDSSSFRYIYEEAANDNLELANEEVFTHWFVEEDVTGRLLELLSVFDKDEALLIHSFAKDFRCLQGAKDNNNRSYRYKDSKNPRGSILWDCALCVAADMESYDRYDGWYKQDNSLFSCFKSTVKKFIENSGFEGVNYENTLDVYIAYSLYRSLPKLKAYKERFNIEKEQCISHHMAIKNSKVVADKAGTPADFLQASIKTMYCKEDFEAWLEEINDPALCGSARRFLCEGLKALNISCKTDGGYEYYRSLIFNHSDKTKKIVSRTEMENQLLMMLFEAWNSKSGKTLRESISKRLDCATISLNDYYKEIFIYFEDDIARLGGSKKKPKDLWFSDEKIIVDKIVELYKDDPSFQTNKAELFVKSMHTLEGLYPDGETKVWLSQTNNITRTNLLWLSYDYTISQAECFGGYLHYQSFPDMLTSFQGDELKKAGFTPIDYRNCLDVYLAYSAYRQINALPKRRRGRG